MLYFFYGTDRAKAREAMNEMRRKVGKDATMISVTDAHSSSDLAAALHGGGMFAQKRSVILDGILGNVEMRDTLLGELPEMQASDEPFFLLADMPDAQMRKRIEKYADESKKFDKPGKARDNNIFVLSNALRRADRKALWSSLMRQFISGAAPEQIHGVLFWAAKDMLLKARKESERTRAERLVAQLAELPHESRRAGEDLEYALERFALSGV